MSAMALVQIRSHPEVLEARAPTCEFGGGGGHTMFPFGPECTAVLHALDPVSNSVTSGN